MEILQLISAAGIGGIIGSILTTIIQSWLSEKARLETRNFLEKKEAYIGLMSAYQKACLKADKEAVLNFALWVDRCELLANDALVSHLNTMKTEAFDLQRSAYSEAKKIMKKDLNFS